MERLSFFSGILLIVIAILNLPTSWKIVGISVIGVILVLVASSKMWSKK